ncbi:hypothetical protein CEP54_009092 [Fusarium duplospermum]|uniref:Myb-like domain-containing protein n=1 Tax=Fusarium duplospermum TaxID=1325734 RepID=A0A428PSD3_9HYPO|nr:hypothetical protein CEP54_009092 [Fusarium duplospermum]
MPPKKTNTEEGAPTGLTDGELRFIKAIFDNMTQKPDADWDAVATTLGLKDAKCAKERFRQMSVRHGWRDQSSAGATASPRKAAAGDKVTKKRATPRKKAAAKKAEKDEEDEETKEEVKAEDKKDVVKSEDVDDDTE